ncbi:helix-turn-helix domain-containing protein [Escherichia coli]
MQDEKNWNLSDIAKHAMVSPQAVQQWAKGKSLPRGQGLKRLAAAAGKAEHWFFMSPDSTSREFMLDFAGRELDDNEKLLFFTFQSVTGNRKTTLAYFY